MVNISFRDILKGGCKRYQSSNVIIINHSTFLDHHNSLLLKHTHPVVNTVCGRGLDYFVYVVDRWGNIWLQCICCIKDARGGLASGPDLRFVVPYL